MNTVEKYYSVPLNVLIELICFGPKEVRTTIDKETIIDYHDGQKMLLVAHSEEQDKFIACYVGGTIPTLVPDIDFDSRNYILPDEAGSFNIGRFLEDLLSEKRETLVLHLGYESWVHERFFLWKIISAEKIKSLNLDIDEFIRLRCSANIPRKKQIIQELEIISNITETHKPKEIWRFPQGSGTTYQQSEVKYAYPKRYPNLDQQEGNPID